MSRLFLILALLSLAACSSEREAPKARPSESPCDFRTKLVPGIPGSPGNLIPSARNPNGVSELAQLMRQFVEDLDEAKRVLASGEKPKKLFPTHKRMRCSWHTVPSERNEAYDRRAKSHLDLVQAFDDAPGQDSFNAIIQSCIACHSVSCQGPISFLTRMQWQ